MSVMAFSPEFAEEFAREINASDAYRKAARGWKWTVGLVVEAEPDRGLAEPVGVHLDLFDGSARDVHIVPVADAAGCDFVIAASYSNWKRVMLKELDTIKGLLQGKLKLKKGALPTIVLYTKAAQELVECTTRIDTRFPDQ